MYKARQITIKSLLRELDCINGFTNRQLQVWTLMALCKNHKVKQILFHYLYVNISFKISLHFLKAWFMVIVLWVSIFVFAPALYLIPYTSYFHLKNCQCEWIINNKKYISIWFTKEILWNEMKWKLKCYIFYFCLWSLDNLFYKWCTEKLYEKTNTALVTGR